MKGVCGTPGCPLCESVPNPIDPPHYKGLSPEPVDVIEGWGLNYRVSCAMKYIARHGRKGDAAEDLRKAVWYLQREIAALEKLTAGS